MLLVYPWSSNGMIDRAKLEKWFGPNVMSEENAGDPRCQEIRLASLNLATTILDNTPASADQSTAIREVRSAFKWSMEANLHESS